MGPREDLQRDLGCSGDEGGNTEEGNAAGDMQPREGPVPASSLEIVPGERP